DYGYDRPEAAAVALINAVVDSVENEATAAVVQASEHPARGLATNVVAALEAHGQLGELNAICARRTDVCERQAAAIPTLAAGRGQFRRYISLMTLELRPVN